ncbi:hypothetical protein OLMES_5373 [Oleiphilus messinensis]|uniref:Uncharacterized protein n=1 Tax=Oleiphilus messinensis TaxID=141451 RepID=A0A1Y0IIU4_9GAMM|nr:hypothetical protein OLMES_5373 [Oleiphilus messinensis]
MLNLIVEKKLTYCQECDSSWVVNSILRQPVRRAKSEATDTYIPINGLHNTLRHPAAQITRNLRVKTKFMVVRFPNWDLKGCK